MSKSPKAKKLANGHARSPKKRKYTTTTAVGRVGKHLERAQASAKLALARMEKWRHAESPNLNGAIGMTLSALIKLKDAGEQVDVLSKTNWVPPRRQVSLVFREGDGVKIAKKYQAKYLQIYSKPVVNNLEVAKVLDSGEIVVNSSVDGSPAHFLVVKSHLEKRHEA